MIKEAIETIKALAVAASGNQNVKISETEQAGSVNRIMALNPAGYTLEYRGPGLNYVVNSVDDFVVTVNDLRKRGVDSSKLPPIMVGDWDDSFVAAWQHDADRNLKVELAWEHTAAFVVVTGAMPYTPQEALYLVRRVLGCDPATVQIFRQVRLRRSDEASVVIEEGRQRETLGKTVERDAAGLPDTIRTGPIKVFDLDEPELTAASYELDVVVDYAAGKLVFQPVEEVVRTAKAAALAQIAQRIRDSLANMAVVNGRIETVKS